MLAAPIEMPHDMPKETLQAHAAIIAAIKEVPAGCTASYGGVARAAGVPGRARLVGWVLRNAGMDLPWHRIVRADGRSAFAEGSLEWSEQRARLAAEGLLPGNHGAYSLAARGGASDLDALLWKPAIAGNPGAGDNARNRAGSGRKSETCRH